MRNLYSKQFYEESLGSDYSDRKIWSSFFGQVASKIVEEFNPKIVLDAGCASGYLVEALRDLGVEAYGIDISEYAISCAREDIKEYLNVQSLTEDLPQTFPQTYDLVVTIEVLEHLYAEDGKKAIERICSYADTVIFTSTPYDLDNKTHVNVQQREYWVELFAKNSFYRDFVQRVDFICPHALLFRRGGEDISRVLFNYELAHRVDELHEVEKTDKKEQYVGRVYFDCGQGYSEGNKAIFSYDDSRIFTERIGLPANCQEIRIDFIEDAFCIISNLVVGSDVGVVHVLSTNATISTGDMYFFQTMDPQIACSLEGKSPCWIDISAYVMLLPSNKELDLVENLLKHEANRMIEEQNNTIAIKENEKQEWMLRFEEQKKESLNKQAENEGLIQKLEEQKKVYLDKQVEIEELTQELEEQKQLHLDKQAENKELIQGLEEQTKVCLEKQQETDKLIQELEEQKQLCLDKQAENEQLIQGLKEQTTACLDRQKEIKELILQLEAQKKECFNKQVENEELILQLETQKKAYLDNQVENKELIQKLKEQKKICLDKQIEKEKLIYELEEQKEEYRKQQMENEELIRQLEKQKRKCLEKQTKNEELLQQLEEQKKKYLEKQKENEELLLQLEKQNKFLQRELEDYKKHYMAAIDQRETFHVHYSAAMDQKNALQVELDNTREICNMYANSFCWKITKPLRWVLDGTKKFIRLTKPGRYFLKGLHSLRTSGVKKTWEKVRFSLSKKQQLKAFGERFYLSEEERTSQENVSFANSVKFSILVPLYNTPMKFLEEMIASVCMQTYKNWELCLADGSDAAHEKEVGNYCRKLQKKDERIKYVKLEKNGGISENTNACIDMATGEYIALFDHDDLLHPSALYEMMCVIEKENADYIYTDEATFEGEITNIITAHFKPDYAIDTLRGNNYICHFSAFKRELLDKAGRFRKEYDGSQDHDIILRLTDKAEKVYHIPKILYYWRSHPASVAADISSKTYAIDAGKRAVKDSIESYGDHVIVESSKAFPTIYRLKYELKETPLVSIIIPCKDHVEDTERCISSILERSTYKNYEILLIDNASTKPETFAYLDKIKKEKKVRVIHWNHPFNYSAINNYAAREAKGKYLLLLNNDTEVITPEWIEEMLMYAQRNDVGAVGAKLYYADDTIQHAGIILGIGADRVAGHAHYRQPKENLGYMGRLYYAQNMSAVTAACILIKKSVFVKINGLDEKFSVAYNDVDLCMRIRKAGYLIVFTPYAELYHYESKSRGLEDTPEKRERFLKEAELFKKRWKKELEQGDPYFNPNFDLDRDDFSIRK